MKTLCLQVVTVFAGVACCAHTAGAQTHGGVTTALGADPAARTTHPILSPEFQARTDEETGTSLTSGNQLELLENGLVSFPRKLELLRSAKHTIRFSTMVARRDATGKAFSNELIAAAKRGVDVRCILDGKLSTPLFRRSLRKGGVEVVVFNKLYRKDRKHRLHAKILVVDGDTAIVGGMNMSDAFNLGDGENKHFKDSDLFVHGKAAQSAGFAFQGLWNSLKDEDDSLHDAVAPSPATAGAAPAGLARFLLQQGDLGQTSIRDYYARCFDAASSRIMWHVNNINPHGPAFAALRAAAARGVRVVCISRSEKAARRMFGKAIGTIWYRTTSKKVSVFVEAGIEVWEMDVGVHSKAVVVDGVMASVGSYNLGSAKSDQNLESTYVVHDPALVASVEAMLERDLARAQRVMPEDSPAEADLPQLPASELDREARKKELLRRFVRR